MIEAINSRPPIELMTGFESTFQGAHNVDNLVTTEHLDRFASDLALVKSTGIKTIRYPVPWHRIETEAGKFNWEWMDEAIANMEELGIDPIADPLHHTSTPSWLKDGFANPEFPQRYADFVALFATRYPFVKKFTPINEPLTTSVMSGETGIWPPFLTGDRNFVHIATNLGRAAVLATELIRQDPDNQIIHVDTAEYHITSADHLKDRVKHKNERRFLFHDLLLGRINDEHPLFEYLNKYGFTQANMNWFNNHQIEIDVLGVDYYFHSEVNHGAEKVEFNLSPRGFAEVAGDYAKRYNLPIMLTETNIRGYVSDKISWLKYMLEQSRELMQQGVDFRGLCWFPFIDSTDWDTWLQQANGRIDPVGVFWLDKNKNRQSSSFSRIYERLAKGDMSIDEIPAYHYREDRVNELSGFIPYMKHWNWEHSTE